jgi:hypothetical protein
MHRADLKLSNIMLGVEDEVSLQNTSRRRTQAHLKVKVSAKLGGFMHRDLFRAHTTTHTVLLFSAISGKLVLESAMLT